MALNVVVQVWRRGRSWDKKEVVVDGGSEAVALQSWYMDRVAFDDG
ncbi:MAG: hypothetical protein NVS4B8_22530 [Herpetosiphon sp.]